MQQTQTRLAFHGSVILFLGLLAGIGFSYAAALDLDTYGSWRFAHMEGIINGIMVLAVAGVWQCFNTQAQGEAKALLVGRVLLVVGAYCNIIGPWITALFIGHRVIEPQTALEAFVVYGFYIPGTLPLISLPIFIYYFWQQRNQ